MQAQITDIATNFQKQFPLLNSVNLHFRIKDMSEFILQRLGGRFSTVDKFLGDLGLLSRKTLLKENPAMFAKLLINYIKDATGINRNAELGDAQHQEIANQTIALLEGFGFAHEAAVAATMGI